MKKCNFIFTIAITIALIIVLILLFKTKLQLNNVKQNMSNKDSNQNKIVQDPQDKKPNPQKEVQKNKNQNQQPQQSLPFIQQKQKIQYHKKRIAFFNNIQKRSYYEAQNRNQPFKRSFDALPAFLVKYNMNLTFMNQTQAAEDMAWDYQRLNAKFQLSSYNKQLPMCVVITSFKNNVNYRLQYNLNSVFWQNYTNFKVVYTDDVSGDGSQEFLDKYFADHKISPNRGVLVKNKVRKHSFHNIYTAITQYCDPNAIVVSVDGDDELIGRNVLKTVNAMYLKTRPGLVFSQYFMFNMQRGLANGGPGAYHTANDKRNNLYRSQGFITSHLRTFLVSLFKEIKVTDLQDENGVFYWMGWDVAMMFPMLQMTCGRNEHIAEYQYLYSMETGLNDYTIDISGQRRVQMQVRRKPKYPCSQSFLNKVQDDSFW